MPQTPPPPSEPDRERRDRLRLIQIRVHDTRSPHFAAEAHRHSLAVARSEHAEDEQAFIEAITDDR